MQPLDDLTNIARGTADNYARLQDKSIPPRVKDIIEDLEAKIPNLPPKQQTQMLHRIASMKTAAKTEAFYLNNEKAKIELFQATLGLVGGTLGGLVNQDSVGGAVGSSIATYLVHDKKTALESKSNQRIQKAEKVAGRRRPQRNVRHQKSEKTSALKEAVTTGVREYAKDQSNFGEAQAQTSMLSKAYHFISYYFK